MPIDFIADEESPDSSVDFTPDQATAVAPAPRPIIAPPASVIGPQTEQQMFEQGMNPLEEERAYNEALDLRPNVLQPIPEPSLRERLTRSDAWRRVFGPSAEERSVRDQSTGSPGELLSTALKFTTVPPPIAEPIRAVTDPLINLIPNETARGVTRGVRELGMNVPGIMAAGQVLPAGKAALAAFAGQAVWELPEQEAEFKRALREDRRDDAAAIATQAAGMGALLIGGAAHGAVSDAAQVSRGNAAERAQAQDIALQLTDPRYAQRQVVLPETLRELANEPSTTGEPNASSQQEAATVHGDLRPQPGEGEGKVSAAESGGGVQPLQPGDTTGTRGTAEAGTTEVPLTLTPAIKVGEQIFKGKAHPLAIGEASKSLAPDAPIEDLFKPESQGFTATDPTTGKERFVSRKEAADIFEKQTGKKPTTPDKLTSEDLRDAGLLGHLDEKPAAAPEATKPEVVKQGKSRFKNPNGDPLGTTYRATPEDWKSWQETKASLDKAISEGSDVTSPEVAPLIQKNEALKNKYGGMPPEPPKATTNDLLSKDKLVAEALPADLPSLARLRVTKPELRPQIDAKIAELQSAAAPAAAVLKQLPPVPAGHVRLFHGEGGPQGGGTGGAFYTSNIAKASTFGQDISWVDLPTDRATAAFAKAKASAFAGGDNFILEPSDISRSQKINQKVEPPTHNLDEPAAASPAPPAPRGIAASARVPGALKGGEAGAVSLAPLVPVAKAAVDFVKGAPTAMKVVGAQLAGKSAPKTSTASVESGNALIRYASSKIAAPLVAESMATDVLGTHYKDAAFGEKLGAVLVEDRLRAIKDAFTKAGDTKAARKVNSLIGKQDSPFKTEAEFQAALADPEIRAAIDRHKTTVQPAAEAAHEEAGGTLAGPGLNTGAFVNLKAIFEGGEENLLRGGGRGNLMNPLRRPSRFSKTAAGTAEKYETDYRTIAQRMIEGNFEESTKRQMYDQLVNDGLAKMLNPGDPAPEIGGKPAVKFVIERKGVPAGENKVRTYVKNLWVRSDLAGEVRQALDVDGPVQRSGIVNAATLLNRIQLAGPTDAVWHVANGLGSIAGSQGGKNVLVDMMRKLPGVNLPDAIGRVVASSIKVLAKTPEVQRQIAELADIGAMRAKGVAKEGRLARIANFNHNVIAFVDKSMRLVRDDMYKNLVRRGWVEDTPAERREWVNQMGQYNGRLMGQFQRFFKDAGFSPFVVAGRNFNRMAMRRITMDPGIKAISPTAAAQMRAVEAFGTIATLFAIPALANYLLTGTPGGRPGTKMGQIDTGKDDQGKHIVIDPAQWTGHRRGLRISGLQAVIEGAQRGETRGRITQNVIRDIMGGVIHPWAGPAINAASVAYTGRSPTGYQESENPSDYGKNIVAALQQLNPAAGALLKGHTEKTGAMKQAGLSLAGAVGVKEVKPFTSYNKMGVLHQAWMANNPDPKVKADYEQMQTATFPTSKYKALDDALARKDEAGAVSAIADLKAEGQKNKDILHRMRPFVGEGITSRTKPLFHESHKLESAFRNSLNPEQKAEYQKALKERKDTYQEFLKAWHKRGTVSTTAPKIDFVPDAGQ